MEGLELWLKLYGPLGLGWPLAFFLLYRLIKVQDRVTEMVESNTKVLTLLAERIRVLAP